MDQNQRYRFADGSHPPLSTLKRIWGVYWGLEQSPYGPFCFHRATLRIAGLLRFAAKLWRNKLKTSKAYLPEAENRQKKSPFRPTPTPKRT